MDVQTSVGIPVSPPAPVLVSELPDLSPVDCGLFEDLPSAGGIDSDRMSSVRDPSFPTPDVRRTSIPLRPPPCALSSFSDLNVPLSTVDEIPVPPTVPRDSGTQTEEDYPDRRSVPSSFSTIQLAHAIQLIMDTSSRLDVAVVARRTALILNVDLFNRSEMDRIFDAVFAVALYERLVLSRILNVSLELLNLDRTGRSSMFYLLCELIPRADRLNDIFRPDSPSPLYALPASSPDLVYISDEEEG